MAGVEWPDSYASLRDDKRQRPEVLEHLRAENACTEAMTRHTARLQERLEAQVDRSDSSAREQRRLPPHSRQNLVPPRLLLGLVVTALAYGIIRVVRQPLATP